MSEEPTRKGISLSSMKYHMAMSVLITPCAFPQIINDQSKCACLLHGCIVCAQRAENARRLLQH